MLLKDNYVERLFKVTFSQVLSIRFDCATTFSVLFYFEHFKLCVILILCLLKIRLN